MERDIETDTLENLLLSLKPDGTYKIAIITYHTTAQEKEDIFNGINIDLTEKVSSTIINSEALIVAVFGKATDCTGYVITEYCSCINPNTNESYHNSGTGYESCSGDCYQYDREYFGCGAIGGDSDGSTTGGDPTGEDTSGGEQTDNGGSGNGSTDVTTTTGPCRGDNCPEELCVTEEAVNSLASSLSLSPELVSCLESADDCNATNELNNFLTNNPTETAFAQLAAQAICEGGEVDYEDKVILDPTFTANQKVKCVYDKLKGQPDSLFDDIIDDYFDSTQNANLTFTVASITTGEDAQTRAAYNPQTGVTQYNIVFDTTFVQNASSIELALALIHESIHAELIERCVRLGLIASVSYLNNQGTSIVFNNSPQVYTLPSMIFNALLISYNAYPPGNSSDWNHEFFNALSYRTTMAQDLVALHILLNDSNNDFLTNVNNDISIVGGPYTIEELMNYISWIGLENTQDYISTIQNVPVENNKKQYVETAARTKYTNSCTN